MAFLPYNQMLDANLELNFCMETQRIPLQHSEWPRLEAQPGAIICPRYHQNASVQGEVHWYGTNNSESPDSRSLSDILEFAEKNGKGMDCISESEAYTHDLLGLELPQDERYNCSGSFQIPFEIYATNTFVVYWMLNTTQEIDGGFLVYSL